MSLVFEVYKDLIFMYDFVAQVTIRELDFYPYFIEVSFLKNNCIFSFFGYWNF